MSVYVKTFSRGAINISQVQSFKYGSTYVKCNIYGVIDYGYNYEYADMYINVHGGLIEFNRNYDDKTPHFNTFELGYFRTPELAKDFYELLLKSLNDEKNVVYDIADYCGFKELLLDEETQKFLQFIEKKPYDEYNLEIEKFRKVRMKQFDEFRKKYNIKKEK